MPRNTISRFHAGARCASLTIGEKSQIQMRPSPRSSPEPSMLPEPKFHWVLPEPSSCCKPCFVEIFLMLLECCRARCLISQHFKSLIAFESDGYLCSSLNQSTARKVGPKRGCVLMSVRLGR